MILFKNMKTKNEQYKSKWEGGEDRNLLETLFL